MAVSGPKTAARCNRCAIAEQQLAIMSAAPLLFERLSA
jgi:hypothetical protein